MSETERRDEAERAWQDFTRHHRVPYEWVASVGAGFREGYLAGDAAGEKRGDAAGYARAIQLIEHLAESYRQVGRLDWRERATFYADFLRNQQAQREGRDDTRTTGRLYRGSC